MKNNDKAASKKAISLARILARLLPMVLAACPLFFILSNVVGIVHGSSYGVITFVSQLFFDSVTDAAANRSGLGIVLWMAAALGAATIGSQVLNGVHNFMGSTFNKKMAGFLSMRINQKASRIDPASYESPELLDDINKANEGMSNSLFLLFTAVTIFTFYLPYFLFMGIYLFTLKPVLALSLILIFIPVALTQLIRGAVFARLEDQAAPIRREYEYLERCICDREYFKETRILGAFGFFKDLYRTALALLGQKTWNAEFKTGLLELGMKMITLAGYFGVLYLLFAALLRGEISIGAFAAVFASIGLMFGIMEEIISRHIGSMTKNLGTVRNFIRFLDLPEREGKDVPVDAGGGIIVKHASFRYPGAESDSLSDVSLEVKKGETIAIVGENGAGKTTLVKLMIGLYLPTEGSVRIGGKDGVDTKEASPQSVFRGISAIFQKYQRYKMTLGENIQLSDLEQSVKADENVKLDMGDPGDGRIHGPNSVDSSDVLIQELAAGESGDVRIHGYGPAESGGARIHELTLAAEKADLDIGQSSFPHGYATMLSREFDGVDLSGGQWQRVAIARGFYRAHGLIVLDEPTAAIDPLEETRIYRKFAEMSKDNTSIIVTHRLGSAKIADRIVVMDQGRIVEIGTHDELLQAGGKYAEMFKAQAQWYVV